MFLIFVSHLNTYTMYYKTVSDLDYAYGSQTGKYDVPTVEWSTEMGTFWERFESEEARDLALAENEAHLNLPLVKAQMEADMKAEDLWRAEAYSSDVFEWGMENSKTLELSYVLYCVGCFSDTIKKRVTELVCLHNKLIMKARVQPTQATFTLGDVF